MTKGKGRLAWLRVLCALSLLLVAFAHKPLDSTSAELSGYADVELAAFALPDGTLPSICLTGGDSENEHNSFNGCEACRLVSSAGLPPVPGQVSIFCALASARPAIPASGPVVASIFRHVASPRAPPLRST